MVSLVDNVTADAKHVALRLALDQKTLRTLVEPHAAGNTVLVASVVEMVYPIHLGYAFGALAVAVESIVAAGTDWVLNRLLLP